MIVMKTHITLLRIKLFLTFMNSSEQTNKRIVTVTSLTSKLESFMLSGEVKFVLLDSARKHICRLESELANSIHILQDAKGKLCWSLTV